MGMQVLRDEEGPFDVTVLEASHPSRVVLFSVGGGGNPLRHGALLAALAGRGFTVAAPHFERMVSPFPTEDGLLLRARRLVLALDAVSRPDVPSVGVGHSIGAATLLALAGAQAWMGPGHPLPIRPDDRIRRLALMAPATGFFQAPGAFDLVEVPVLAWAGTRDTVTPPAQAEMLAAALGHRGLADVRVVDGAGHFSFMDDPPPNVAQTLPDRAAFLANLADEIAGFVTGDG
ncbi:MAG: hypothetical protein RJA59_115 [Pseudomonadota bacterium]